jgi:hypothetical protein
MLMTFQNVVICIVFKPLILFRWRKKPITDKLYFMSTPKQLLYKRVIRSKTLQKTYICRPIALSSLVMPVEPVNLSSCNIKIYTNMQKT